MNNSLIFGKNPKERIVAINASEKEAILYVQDEDGSIRHDVVLNKFWFLSDERLNDKAIRLNGNLHYKWGYQFSDKTSYIKTKSYFSKSRDIFNIYNPEEALMTKDGYTLFKGMKTSDLSVLSFDIETTGTVMDETSNVLLIANTFRDSHGNVTCKMFSYNDYENQGEMIRDWCVWVRSVDPTVVCGHNINLFDIPYIKLVADRYDVSLDLGRDGSALKVNSNESKFRKEGGQFITYNKNSVVGRHIIDTFFLAIKYDAASRKYDSYGLKYIINAEGLEAKDRQFYDASKIKDNYKIPAEWEKIKRYAEKDGDDSLALYDLMIPAYFYFTQSTPKTLQVILESSTGSPLNSILVRSYLQDKHSIPKADDIRTSIEGGISFAVPGIYRNMVKVDLKSAYPSQILRFKLYDKNKDPEANFYKMVHHFTYERFDLKDKYKETKDKYYKDREQAGKITINSAYGLCQTAGLNFNSQEIAAKITFETRELINMALKWASGKDKDYWIKLFEEKTK